MKISKRQIVRNMEKFIGKECIIQPPNPHADSRGKMINAILKNNKPTAIIKLENDKEIYVHNNNEMMFLVPREGELNDLEKRVMNEVRKYANKN